jgi:activator of HSP90 ATPase
VKSSNQAPIGTRSLTRRQSIQAAALAFGAIAAGSATAWATPTAGADSADGSLHNAEAVHQEPVFAASPSRIYEVLTDSKQFQKVQLLSGAMKESDLIAKPAEISREPGGPLTLFGGYVTGRQIELTPNKRIVQAWRPASWPLGVYSIAKFELVANGSGTKVIFDHTGIPAGTSESLASGWNEHYWQPLTKYLA